MSDFNRLPRNQTYAQSFLPFILPYLFYTGVEIFNSLGFALWVIQLMKLVLVGSALWFYRRNYSIGRMHSSDLVVAFLVAPALAVIWVYPLKFFLSFDLNRSLPLSLNMIDQQEWYFMLRSFNSIILTPFFEELFFRVYLLQLLFHAGSDQSLSLRVWFPRLVSLLDQKPDNLDRLPFSLLSVVGTTFLFAIGHGVASWFSAILYFSLGHYLYWRTQSLWTPVLIHGFTNLIIAYLVRYADLQFLWF